MIQLITLQVTEEDAILYKEFCRRYAFIKLMESIGAFNLKSATLSINYDGQGNITSLEKKEHFKV